MCAAPIKVASPDWDKITELMRKFSPAIEGAAADGALSEEEIVLNLDVNKDGKTTLADVRLIPVPIFQDLDSICLKHGIDLSKKIDIPRVKMLKLRDYDPTPSSKKYKLEDNVLDTFFTKSVNNNELPDVIRGKDVGATVPNSEKFLPKISNAEEFKKDVLKEAKRLGYDEKKIANLSISESVVLSGMLTAIRLGYEYKMLNEGDEQLSKEEKMAKMLGDSLAGKDVRNDWAVNVDNAAVDELFASGAGICRNYAMVNAGVFLVLKEINPSLKNTYMRSVSPGSIADTLALPHAWNMVSTLTDEGVEVAFVDPTWLDTRTNFFGKELNVPSDPLKVKDAYEAFDEKHFDLDMVDAQSILIELFENAGSSCRFRVNGENSLTEEQAKMYDRHSFGLRIEQGRRILKLLDPEKTPATEKTSYRSHVMFMMRENFAKAIEKLLGFSLDLYSQLNKKEIEYEIQRNPFFADAMKSVDSLYEEIRTTEPEVLNYGYADRNGSMMCWASIQEVYDLLNSKTNGLLNSK